MKTMIDYLNDTVKKFPNKNAFIDSNRSITFLELEKESKCIASSLIEKGLDKKSIIIFLEKSVECTGAFLGVARSGNFSTIMDLTMPIERIIKIFSEVEPKLIITDNMHMDIAKKLIENNDIDILIYEDAMKKNFDEKILIDRENGIKPKDILLTPFTSGSTGVPKAIIVHHGYVNNYIDWQVKRLPITSDLICGCLIPMCYGLFQWYLTVTVVYGITTYLIPQKLIREPVKLMKYLFDNKISMFVWVPSMLAAISEFRCLDKPYLPDLKIVLFCGEAMLARHINNWRKYYKNTRFYCMYTSTECIDNELLFEVVKDFDDNNNIPIGKKSDSASVVLINDNGEEASKGEEAELYFKIYGESYGYYNDPIKTRESFVQNPIKDDGHVYFKSGDIVKINDEEDIEYVSRKDSQIKYMGQRINLGEIESTVSLIDKIKNCVAMYYEEKKQICLCYEGDIKEQELISIIKEKIPNYMMPKKIVKFDSMPLNLNGKLDRKKLRELLMQ